MSWLDTATLASPDRSRFPEQRDAITWLGNERGNLLGVIAIAEERQYHACVEDIARALVAFFINDGRADECLPLCERVLDSAQRRKATGSQGNFLGFLGWALREQGRTEDATRCFASALELFRRCGSPEQEGCALGWLGLAAAAAGDFDRAREHYLRALDIHREWHDAHGEGT
ncbi:tetratricopeptide repeat protein, partial [Streptomyces sp. MCAF7]